MLADSVWYAGLWKGTLMKHYLTKSHGIALGLFLIGAGWCTADTFLVPEKPSSRRTRQQLKQEIAQLMGVLIEQSSISLEREAQIQQKLCREVRAAVEGTDSSLNKGTVKDLEGLLLELKKEHRRRTDLLIAQQSFLALLK